MSKWLIVDDEPAICWGLRRLIETLGEQAVTCGSAEEALQVASRDKFDGIVLDVRLPGRDGLSVMAELRKQQGDVPIVVITAFGDLPTAVTALERGAFEYLVKPFDLKVAEDVIRRAHTRGVKLAKPAEVKPQGTIVGQSAPMQQVFKQIALAAGSQAAIFISGESGSGKELVARAIHQFSARRDAPFVPVHLASLNESLVESQLFGHTRGAFTGADHERVGLLQQADGGTVFLDEIAETPPAIQAKLLRAIEYGEVLPIGASRPIHVKLRVISATHRDLAADVAQGRFREDLLFRLNTFVVTLPALRERIDDIPLLAQHFLQLCAATSGEPAPTLAESTIVELQRRTWPGNVRQLRNAIEHAVIVARGGVILPEHLPTEAVAKGQGGAPASDAIREQLTRWAQEQWRADEQPEHVYERLLELVEPPVFNVALQEHHGQLAPAARSLGIHRITLRKKLGQSRD